jgi:hypothetical protein
MASLSSCRERKTPRLSRFLVRLAKKPSTACHKAKENGWTDDDFYTDLGNARRLVREHGDNIRFVPEWRKWIIWSENHWQVDNDGAVLRLAKDSSQGDVF